MKNWKDSLTTILGIIAALCGAIITASQSGLTMPTWLITAAGGVTAVCIALIGWLTGKNPDLTSKTPGQIMKANTGQ